MSIVAAIALLAAQSPVWISPIDRHDIRCAWAFINAANEAPTADRYAIFMGENWYEGRVIGRHENFGVSSAILQLQFSRQAPPDSAELTACAKVMADHSSADLAGRLASMANPIP